jgi:hypothetical protein
MIEYSILKCFIEDQSLYEKYNTSLKLDFIRQNYPILNRLFKCLPSETFNALEATYLASYPCLKDGERDALNKVINDIKLAECDNEAIITYLESHLARVWASDISLMALDVANGVKNVNSLDEIIAARDTTVEVLDDFEFVTTDIETLMQEDEQTPGLKWRLKCLNQSLGQLRKGNFGHIFARVETGKTAMWISETTYMAEQVEKPILILFNEEGGRDVVYRMYNAVTGMTYLEVITNPKLAKKMWDERVGED